LTERPGPAARDIGLYVHWPYCTRICPYCDFNVVRDRGRTDAQAALAEAIMADLRAQAAGTGPRRLVSVFFGGGTPSLMAPEWVGRILDAARAAFAPAPDLEITLEANPTDAESERFAALRAAGVARLSLGLQSLNDHALAFLGRTHRAAEGRRAAELGARIFPRLSLDLIYALPAQSPAAWRAELADAIALGPEHVSAYQLTIEPGTAFARAVERGRLAPAPEALAAELYETTGEVLGRAGFVPYEVSNHALGAAARSRHNLLYWSGGDWLGVGPGAHGRITDGPGVRWATRAARQVQSYVDLVGRRGCGLEERSRLSPAEVGLERLLMGLRTLEGVRLKELEALGIPEAALRSSLERGLIARAGGRIAATPRGRLVLDAVTLDLARAAKAG